MKVNYSYSNGIPLAVKYRTGLWKQNISCTIPECAIASKLRVLLKILLRIKQII